MIVATSHATLVDGHIYEAPANTVVESLKLAKVPFIFVRHSIDGAIKSKVYEFSGRGVVEKKLLPVRIKMPVVRYLLEILVTVFYFSFKRSSTKKIKLFIGVDPLNALSGIVLKKLKVVEKVVFYSVDFSDTRFDNQILNSLYINIDKFCSRNSDEVWSVSSRIVDLRENMGVARASNIYIPNTPSSGYKKYLRNKRDKYCLVTLGKIDKQMNFTGVFHAIRSMKNVFPEIKFKIIGSGPMLEEYKRQTKVMGIERNVLFLGSLEHDEALYQISTSGIGLALYNGTWSFNYYGDSMKCREYFCFGLPVLTTNTHSTVEDITKYGAGLVIDNKSSNYRKSIRELLDNYDSYSKNSYKIANIYDGGHIRNIKRICGMSK